MKQSNQLWIIILLFFIVIFHSNIFADSNKRPMITAIPAGVLKFQGNTIFLETPLIKKNDIIYFPINDFGSHFNAQISFNRRFNKYHMSLRRPKISAEIIVGTNEVWINNLQQFLNASSLNYENRLYIPMISFFKLAGFSLNKEGNVFEISAQDKEISRQHRYGVMDDEENLTVISELKLPAPELQDITLPNMEMFDKWSILVGEKQYPMENVSLYDKRDLYVKLDDFFKKDGYQVMVTDSSITLEKEFTRIIFSLYDLNVHVVSGHQEKVLQLEKPIIQRGRSYYFPFFSLISILDFTPHWDSETKTLSLLKNIRHIRVVKDDLDFKLQIFSSQGLVSAKPIQKITESKLSNEMILSLPSTQITESKAISLAQSPISNLSIAKEDSTSTKITLKLRQVIQATSITKTDFGSEVSFKTTVKAIEQLQKNDKLLITIKTNGPFQFKSWYERNMFIVDIPDTINNLPQIIRAKHGVLQKIRTSQLTRDPLKTRIVFHLAEKMKIQRNRKDPTTLELSFPVQTKTVARKKVETSRKGIAKKIIFIDPGHGGRDPGAVIRKNIFEKKYTLDISKRLEKKLRKAGAYVVMGRKGDENPSLRRRVVMANRNKADAFISVHINSFTQPIGRGTETYYFKHSEKRLASLIHRNLTKNLKLRNNGLKRTGFYVLRYSKMPSVLVEPLFMTNPKEFQLLQTSQFREKIADSIYQGLISYFN